MYNRNFILTFIEIFKLHKFNLRFDRGCEMSINTERQTLDIYGVLFVIDENQKT